MTDPIQPERAMISYGDVVRHRLWRSVSDEDWTSWTWQLRNRVSDLPGLRRVLDADPNFQVDLADVQRTQREFNFGITPYYLSLMSAGDPDCPIRKQGLPSSLENTRLPQELFDFPKEDSMMPVQGLTHRYPDRVMIYTTHNCAMYCRFCTRKRKVSNAATSPGPEQFAMALEYIRSNPKIRDVVLSGGDVLSYSDEQIEQMLRSLRNIPHVEIIRLGTRNLVTLPFRVTSSLAGLLRRYSPIYIHTHFNHPKECTREAKNACQQLRRSGCVVNNHTVMLKGVNDGIGVLTELNRRLLLMGVQPYYVYHCDLTVGSGHFRTNVAEDLDRIHQLQRDFCWEREVGVSHYVIDTPGGGKVELY